MLWIAADTADVKRLNQPTREWLPEWRALRGWHSGVEFLGCPEVALDLGRGPEGIDLLGFRLPLHMRNLNGHCPIKRSANWRVKFRFDDGVAADVN